MLSWDMVIRNFPRWRPAAILDLVQPEVGPFDPPSPKTPPRIKQEVYRTIRSRDMAIWNAKFDDVINDVTRSGSKIRENEFIFPR